MGSADQRPWDEYQPLSPSEMVEHSRSFYETIQRRRSIRQFDTRPVSRTVIENCLTAAGTAPSGAHQQPWHFVVIEKPDLKVKIREAAEACEQEFYRKIEGTAWAKDLAPLATNAKKPFLTQAPYLIAVFAQKHHLDKDNEVHKHYYVTESVSIALGILITAIHNAGLATVVYTPAPTTFLNSLLNRPDCERALCILPIGHPAPEAQVPNQDRKSFTEISTWYS